MVYNSKLTMRVEDNEIQNLRREVLVGALIAGVVSVMPAHADMFGYVRTEVETGHTMLGRIVTDRPRWVLDSSIGWRTEDYGRAAFSVWTALLKHHPAGKMAMFNLLVPVFGTVLSGLMLGESVWRIKNLLSLILISAGIILVNISRGDKSD